MVKMIFEPGHTSAEFCVRHMMVTWVRGFFKNIKGEIDFDPNHIEKSSVKVEIDAKTIWSGDKQRDGHLINKDFLDTENHPKIKFEGNKIKVLGKNDFDVIGNLTIRGITKEATLTVNHLGNWKTPYWVDEKTMKEVTRYGFVASAKINRHDFKVSWNGKMDKGGVVVGDDVYISLDIEAMPESEVPK